MRGADRASMAFPSSLTKPNPPSPAAKKPKEPKKAKGEKRIRRVSFLGPALVVIAMGLSFALFMRGGVLQGLGYDLSFLLYPFLAMFIAVLISQVIGVLLDGAFVPTIRWSLSFLAPGLFLFMLLSGPPTPAEYRPAALPSLLLFAIIAAYLIAYYFTSELSITSRIVKSAAIILEGLTIWYGLSIVLPSYRGIPTPLVLFAGFAFWSAACLFSALSFTKNPYVSTAGRWSGLLTIPMFILGASLVVYFATLRQPLSEMLRERLVFAEWGTVAILCGVGFFALRSHVKRAAKPVSLGTWAKHLQVVRMKKDGELVDVSRLVRDFVESGSKGGILVHLVSAASGASTHRDRVLRAVEEFIDYEDTPMPAIALRWEVERLKEKNRAARRAVLERTIREIGKL